MNVCLVSWGAICAESWSFERSKDSTSVRFIIDDRTWPRKLLWDEFEIPYIFRNFPMEFLLREIKTGGNGHCSLHMHFQPFVHNCYRLLVVATFCFQVPQLTFYRTIAKKVFLRGRFLVIKALVVGCSLWWCWWWRSKNCYLVQGE